VICQATSTTQVKAISDFVEVQVQNECGEKPFRHEGQQAAQWIIIDYVNVVIHVMQPESRKFYKLEEMWSDAQSQSMVVRNPLNRAFPVNISNKHALKAFI